jgi:hypothetical protein
VCGSTVNRYLALLSGVCKRAIKERINERQLVVLVTSGFFIVGVAVPLRRGSQSLTEVESKVLTL